MTTTAQLPSFAAKSAFPLAEVRSLLRRELEEAADESVILHGGWQPVLDSLRMVTAIAAVEKLLGFRLPPEKVVKKGGHKSVDEGVDYMTNRISEEWSKHNQKGRRS